MRQSWEQFLRAQRALARLGASTTSEMTDTMDADTSHIGQTKPPMREKVVIDELLAQAVLDPAEAAALRAQLTTPEVAASPAGQQLVTVAEDTPQGAARRLTEYTGEALRRLREDRKTSLDEIAAITKIGKSYLCALEAGDFEHLPARVYVRGFVSEYARYLGLDPQQVTQSYMRFYGARTAR